jgi:hypothetical protein
VFVRFQFKSVAFAELVRDQIARSDVGCIRPTGSGFVVERIEFPPTNGAPMDVDRSGDIVIGDGGAATAVRETEVAGVADDAWVWQAIVDGVASEGGLQVRLFPPPVALPNPYETITIPVAGGSTISVSRRRLLLTLPITLHVRTIDQMVENTGEPFVVTIDVRLQVDLVHRANGDFVRVVYDGVGHRDGNDPGVEQLIRTELAGAGVAREVEFEYTKAVLKAVEKLGGGGTAPTVVWSGMTLGPDRQTVEMRVEVAVEDQIGTAHPDAWRQFLGRQIDDFRTGHDWAIEIGRELLDVSATAGAHDQVSNQNDFDLAGGGPYVEWRPDYPGFRTTFTGEIIDACSCFGVNIDLNVRVEVTTKLRLVESGPLATIEVDSVTDGDATHAGEQACCAITGTMFFPILGWVYLADGKIGWGGLALGMFVPVIGSFIAMWQLFDPSPEIPLGEGCRRDGDHQICTYEVSLNAPADPCVPPAATVGLDLLRGRNAGLVLAGSLNQVYRSAPEVGTTRPTPFQWQGPRPTCTGTIGKWSARSDFSVVQIDGGFPLQVCEVLAIGEAGPIYKPHIGHIARCPTTADIDVRTVEWTPGNPNSQPILVLTNVGATLVMVPPLPALTDEEENAHDRFIMKWRRLHCGIFNPGRVAEIGGIETRWAVEAPPDVTSTSRLWTIRAGRLPAGELLVVSAGPEGADLAISEVDPQRGVRIDLLYDGDDLHITRRRPNGEPGPMQDAEVGITQLLLEQLDVRQLDGRATALRPIAHPAEPAIEVTFGDHDELLPISPPGTFAADRRQGWPAATPPRPGMPGRGVVGRLAADDLSDDLRQTVSEACGSTIQTLVDEQIAATMNTWRWIVDQRPEGFLEVDLRAGRVATRYRDRPWFDGTIYLNNTFARLDNDGRVVRTFRVLDSLTL